MRCLILVLTFVTVAYSEDHDFINPNHFATYLRQIEMSSEFHRLSADEKNTFSEMILAAETGASDLTAFIEKHHFEHILEIIRQLDDRDILTVERYLALHLGAKQPSRSDRQAPMDLSKWMEELHTIYKIEDHMPSSERNLFRQLMWAAEHNQLTKFIDEKGYGTVLMIMSYADHDYSDKLDDMIIRHLAMEAAMGIHHSTTQPGTSPHA